MDELLNELAKAPGQDLDALKSKGTSENGPDPFKSEASAENPDQDAPKDGTFSDGIEAGRVAGYANGFSDGYATAKKETPSVPSDSLLITNDTPLKDVLRFVENQNRPNAQRIFIGKCLSQLAELRG